MSSRTIGSVDELAGLVGQELGASPWLEVTQGMIDAFADVTGDHQWIHVDVERAGRESPFGRTIAHGFLTLSLVTRLHAEAVHVGGEKRMGINYGLNRVRFISPVLSGSRIRSRSTLKSVEEIPGGLHITWSITLEQENSDKPALVAEWLTRFYR